MLQSVSKSILNLCLRNSSMWVQRLPMMFEQKMGFTCKTASCFAKNDEFRLAISLKFHECSENTHEFSSKPARSQKRNYLTTPCKRAQKTNKATRTTPNIGRWLPCFFVVGEKNVPQWLERSTSQPQLKALEAKMVPKWQALREWWAYNWRLHKDSYMVVVHKPFLSTMINSFSDCNESFPVDCCQDPTPPPCRASKHLNWPPQSVSHVSHFSCVSSSTETKWSECHTDV